MRRVQCPLRELERISKETERVARQWLNADNLGFEKEKRSLENEAKRLLKDLNCIRERMERFLSHDESDTSGDSADLSKSR